MITLTIVLFICFLCLFTIIMLTKIGHFTIKILWSLILTIVFFVQVLDANPVHVKALYRRGMAYMEAGDYDEARADFNKVNL